MWRTAEHARLSSRARRGGRRAVFLAALGTVVAGFQVGPRSESGDQATLLDRGVQLLRNEEYREAIRVLKQADVEAGGSCHECWLNLAHAYSALGQLKESAGVAADLIAATSDPGFLVPAHTLLGYAAYQRVPVPKGWEERRQAPSPDVMDFRRAMVEAERHFRAAHESDRWSTETVRWNLAATLEWLGRSDEAAALFSSSSTANGARADVRFVTGDVEKPIKISDVSPEYPTMARWARVQGTVVLQTIIGIDGKVSDVRVLRGLPGCTASAIKAVRQWQFEPATLKGQPVPVYFSLTINFQLRK